MKGRDHLGRDNSVVIANRYGPEESGDRIPVGGEIFRPPARPYMWPTQLPVQWVPGPFAGCEAAGAWR